MFFIHFFVYAEHSAFVLTNFDASAFFYNVIKLKMSSRLLSYTFFLYIKIIQLLTLKKKFIIRNFLFQISHMIFPNRSRTFFNNKLNKDDFNKIKSSLKFLIY
jgi:hypothetical protein